MLLGISGCPQCLCSNDQFGNFHPEVEPTPRSMKESIDLITTCRTMLRDKGNITNVNKLLAAHRLSRLHLSMWNPFFLLPHVDFDCFPQDHLHGMYVNLCQDCNASYCFVSVYFLSTKSLSYVAVENACSVGMCSKYLLHAALACLVIWVSASWLATLFAHGFAHQTSLRP